MPKLQVFTKKVCSLVFGVKDNLKKMVLDGSEVVKIFHTSRMTYLEKLMVKLVVKEPLILIAYYLTIILSFIIITQLVKESIFILL